MEARTMNSKSKHAITSSCSSVRNPIFTSAEQLPLTEQSWQGTHRCTDAMTLLFTSTTACKG